MGVVRIDDKLHKKVQEWLNKNGNKYSVPNTTAFVNSAIYEKLKKLREKNEQY